MMETATRGTVFAATIQKKAMEKKKKGEYVLFTNCLYDYVCGWSKSGNYDDGMKALEAEYRGCNDVADDDEVSEDTLRDWASGIMGDDWDAMLGNLSYSKSNGPCVADGYYGLWTGREYGYTVYGSVVEALEDIASFRSYNDLTVRKVGGHLEIEQVHHDGTNRFDIRLLNDRGVKAYARKKEFCTNTDLRKESYHRAMEKYLY
ncbi:MAG: hypothetical protein EOM65_11805 [Synergistales bacterium]|nr:hypothetical protein [Synergistales bacterium]